MGGKRGINHIICDLFRVEHQSTESRLDVTGRGYVNTAVTCSGTSESRRHTALPRNFMLPLIQLECTRTSSHSSLGYHRQLIGYSVLHKFV
ncbi:hypothetical protein RSAG8_06025, partial [Rhizoctonia solani AG-8 WAC10335]